MRKSISAEIAIMLTISLAGALIHYGTILSIIGGVVNIFLTSWFIIPKLKGHTIKEYLKKVEEIEE